MPMIDGGPAFPRAGSRVEYANGEADVAYAEVGMSLRDYFAAQAARLAADAVCDLLEDGASIERVGAECDRHAKAAYMVADAMLKAREGRASTPDMLTALKAHDAYMLDAGYNGPESDGLHPTAAENWRMVRAAIAAAEAQS